MALNLGGGVIQQPPKKPSHRSGKKLPGAVQQDYRRRDDIATTPYCVSCWLSMTKLVLKLRGAPLNKPARYEVTMAWEIAPQQKTETGLPEAVWPF